MNDNKKKDFEEIKKELSEKVKYYINIDCVFLAKITLDLLCELKDNILLNKEIDVNFIFSYRNNCYDKNVDKILLYINKYKIVNKIK